MIGHFTGVVCAAGGLVAMYKNIEYKKNYDVIVIGGGPSGIMAALAAARNGVSTLLIEKNGFLGGAATSAVLGPISPFHFGDEQVINGIPQEFVDRLVQANGSTGHMKALDPYGSGDYLCFYDREKYKYVAAEMLIEENVDILYHSFILSVEKKGKKITGLTAVNKTGEQYFGAKVVVDATGDGDIAVKAGEDYVTGDEKSGKMQPSSAMFEMVDVDTDHLYDYILNNPSEFEWKTDIVPMRAFSERLKQKYFVAQGFKSMVKKAVEDKELVFGRDSILLLNGIHPNSIHFNSTRVGGLDETKMEQRTAGEIDGRRQIESVSEFVIKYLPGFGKSYVSVTNSELGIRETRHIKGLYTLNGQDVINGVKFKDVVSRGYFPIDIHNPDGGSGYSKPGEGGLWQALKDSYDIPYRSLVPLHVDGLVLSGRCISGTSEAHGSYRTQGGIMGIGQASGVAAALCARYDVEPRDLDVKLVQETLIRLGASVFRNEEEKAGQEASATRCVKKFISTRDRFITSGDVIRKFKESISH